MANSIAKLLDSFFDNKMEDFETAFPAAIESVNDDGTVNVRPSVRNCLRNMQMEPNMKDGKLMVIKNVPVLWAGTKTVHIEYELDQGDTVLCISSSRDIRIWKKEKWDEAAYDPVSFSGNDLLNLLAIPFRRVQESATTVINILADNGKMAKVFMSRKKSLCRMRKSRDGAVHTRPGKGCPGVGAWGQGGLQNAFPGSGYGGGLTTTFRKR